MKRKVLIIGMLALMAGEVMAQEDSLVGLRSVAAAAFQNREIVTFTTHNQHEAQTWAQNMQKNGYEVNVEFNPRTGIYTCTATR